MISIWLRDENKANEKLKKETYEEGAQIIQWCKQGKGICELGSVR